MKKLISAAIVILPLLLLAILLVSGAVMGFFTHIYVENLEFSDSEAIVLVMDDMSNPPRHDLEKDITIFPLEATNRKLVYTDYDEDLIEISADGVITPIFYGETYITVQSKENKAATATKKVIVTDTSVHALEFNDYNADLYEGESEELSVSIYPREAENKAVVWSSSDDDILQVGSDGTITAFGNGSVTVTATAVDDTNGEVKATAVINCHAKLKGLIFGDAPVETSSRQAQFPDITTNPSACDVTFEYRSNNPEVAAVDGNGAITFNKEGCATITVIGRDFKGNRTEGSKEYVCTDGYFTGSLFETHSINYADCSADGELPIEFSPSPEGAYRLVRKIECGKDSANVDPAYDNLISYDEATKTFKLNGEFPEFNQYIYVKVSATVYDYATNALNSTYDDYFYIAKTEIRENAKVLRDGEELKTGENNIMEFADIGETITLTIENPDGLIVQVVGNAYVNAVRDGNEVILTSRKVCSETDNVVIQLSIGTKVYNLKMKISAKAEYLKVTCSDVPVSDGQTYKTLLDSLTFDVGKGRADNQQIAGTVKYRLNDEGGYTEVVGSSVTISSLTANKITFVCDDVEFSFNLEKATLSDFGIEPSFTRTEGGSQSMGKIDSVAENNSIKITLPENVQNNLILKLDIDFTDFLGGLGAKDNSDFEKLFGLDLNGIDGWSAEYNAAAGQIVIKFTGTEFNETVTLRHGELSIDLQIVKVNIQSIAFVNSSQSFDSRNADDVRKGYQQVRVFAKHSYYDGKDVDYLKIPLKALSNIASGAAASLDTVSWKLCRYVGDEETELLTSQRGDEVTIKGVTYKIVKDGAEYVLQNGDGATVSGKGGKNADGYIWVDAYTEYEAGYARIYFGNFGGLSESDVYNDYFGNFDENVAWTKSAKPTDNKEGKIIVEPSENAFAFLKIEAGDGIDGGKNCHFNFNVLNDTTDKKLINVFDADGYYEHDNIVLHTNLYGPGEIGKNDENSGLFLDREVSGSSRKDKLSKTTIYGNGYHINLMARNTQLLATTDPSKYGYHNGAAFYGIYNLVLMGSNPTDEIKRSNQAMVFRIGNAYYCDIQYLAKINTFYDDATGDGGREEIGSFSNIKNSVIRYASWACYQLSFPDDQAYFENVVFVESNSAITMENKKNMSCYFNGFIDALCYNTLSKICTDKGYYEGFAYDAVDKTFDKYAEWFGKNNDGIVDIAKAIKNRYVNPVLFVAAADASNKPYFWNGKTYVEEGDDFTVVFKLLGYLPAWTYNKIVEFDGGEMVGGYYTSRNMSKLFDNPENIRLLCQYKGVDESGNLIKNTDHILWHMHRAYRNPLLVTTLSHIDDLKETLKNTTWEDGSGVDGDGNPTDKMTASIMALNRFISCALPVRKEAA